MADLDRNLQVMADQILAVLLAEGMARSEIPRASPGIREWLAPLREQAETRLAEAFAKVETAH
jgi:hypothetical protein